MNEGNLYKILRYWYEYCAGFCTERLSEDGLKILTRITYNALLADFRAGHFDQQTLGRAFIAWSKQSKIFPRPCDLLELMAEEQQPKRWIEPADEGPRDVSNADYYEHLVRCHKLGMSLDEAKASFKRRL